MYCRIRLKDTNYQEYSNYRILGICYMWCVCGTWTDHFFSLFVCLPSFPPQACRGAQRIPGLSFPSPTMEESFAIRSQAQWSIRCFSNPPTHLIKRIPARGSQYNKGANPRFRFSASSLDSIPRHRWGGTPPSWARRESHRCFYLGYWCNSMSINSFVVILRYSCDNWT